MPVQGKYFNKVSIGKNYFLFIITNKNNKNFLYAKGDNSHCQCGMGKENDIIEDLTLIKYALTCKRVVEDIITYNFETKYLLNLPKSIVDKKSKLSRLMTIIDNEYVVDKIRIVINFDTFDRFRTYIFELMKRGFIFDIFLDDKFNYSSDNIEYLVTFEKIFMLKDKYY